MNYKNVIFINAVNITSGGPKVILDEYINIIALNYPNYLIRICTNSKYIIKNKFDNITFLRYDYPLKSIFHRIIFEYLHLFFISLKQMPLYVISFNDITPFMLSKYKIIYVHSPMSFEKIKTSFLKISPIFFFKIIFFRIMHFFTLNYNDIIIVQQLQIKNKIIKLYSIHTDKIFICNPSLNFNYLDQSELHENKNFVLFYPSIPRDLKNIHLVCSAVEKINLYTKYKIVLQLTLDGSENNYSRKIKEKYFNYNFIQFLGIIEREKVLNYISNCNALIFASEFETWGLPISEAKFYNKEIFVLNEEYSHETVSNYKKAIYFTKNNLNLILLNRLRNKIEYNNNSFTFTSQNFLDILNTLK